MVATLAIALILAWLLGACTAQSPEPAPSLEAPTRTPPQPTSTPGPVTPSPHVVTPPPPVLVHTSKPLGLELSYPSEWLLTESKTRVVVGTSEQVIGGGELTSGAGLVVNVAPLPNAEWQSLEELCLSRASVLNSEEMEIGEPQQLTIDGQEATLVTLHGKPGLAETPITGFVAVATWETRAYTFVALSVADEWATHETALREIVEGARLLPREEPWHPPDQWEPDDTLDAASPLTAGTSQTHDLHRQGDRDYVHFQATRGHVYTAETANLGYDLDTRVFLYDCRGNLLSQNDDGRALEEPWASRLVWTAEKTCTHYVMVHDVGDDDAGPGTSYDVMIWEQAYFVEDEYEPDDSPRLATLLKPEEPQAHNLHVMADRDVMRFEAKAGASYILETFDLGDDVDTVLRLLDEEETELSMDDDGRDDEEPRASRIRWTATIDARLYVVVHDAGEDAEGPGTQYWVRIQEAYQ